MKIESSILFAALGLVSLFSSVATAGVSSAEAIHKSGATAAEISYLTSPEKMMQTNIEKKLVAEARKYTQIVALAGERQDEVAKRKAEVASTYAKWRELKSAGEASNNANANDLKAVELAAQAYSQAYKEFIELQKDILAKNGVPSYAVDGFIAKNAVPLNAVEAINAVPPASAGMAR